MARQLDRGKERFWRGMMQHWRRSGLSVRDFCAEHGLAEPSFYAWRRTLTRRDQQAATTSAAHTQHASVIQPLFVPLHVVPTPANAALELVLDQGVVVRVPAGFDAATLRQLLPLLKEVLSC